MRAVCAGGTGTHTDLESFEISTDYTSPSAAADATPRVHLHSPSCLCHLSEAQSTQGDPAEPSAASGAAAATAATDSQPIYDPRSNGAATALGLSSLGDLQPQAEVCLVDRTDAPPLSPPPPSTPAQNNSPWNGSSGSSSSWSISQSPQLENYCISTGRDAEPNVQARCEGFVSPRYQVPPSPPRSPESDVPLSPHIQRYLHDFNQVRFPWPRRDN